LMSNNSNSMSEHAVNYTLNPNFAVGFKNYRLITSEENTTQYYIGHLNWLVKRWNFDRSQANIYLGGGYGTQQATHQTSNQYYSERRADWENRQYYIDGIYTRLWDQQSRDSDIDIKNLRLGF